MITQTASSLVERIADSKPLSLLIGLVGLVGFAITIATYLRVKKVRQAQVAERTAFKRIVRLDDLDTILGRVHKHLQAFRDSLASGMESEELNDLVRRIPEFRGEIRGVLSALGQYVDQTQQKTDFPCYSDIGYYTEEFIFSEARKAKEIFRICAKRNMRACQIDTLQVLADRVKAGCEVELLTVGPDAADAVLEELMQTMPLPPRSVKHLREQLRGYTAHYLECRESMSALERQRFRYFQYSGYPPFHLVQSDRIVHLGLTGFFKEIGDFNILKTRPYITFKRTDPFASKLLRQFETMCKRGTEVLPDNETASAHHGGDD